MEEIRQKKEYCLTEFDKIAMFESKNY